MIHRPAKLVFGATDGGDDEGDYDEAGGDGPEAWLHENITTKAEAEKTLLAGGSDNGTFLVYRR